MGALGRSAWPDLGAPRLLVVPVGATEQHGPHLPLSTDTDIAVALAERVAASVPGAWVAPAVPYGSSGEHQGFPGTLSIGREATRALLVELGRSATETFERVLFLCAHGGNAQPLGDAVGLLRDEGRDARAATPTWSGDAHAGELETSVMLALAPERVWWERAVAGETRPVGELMDALRSGGVRAVSDSGVLGDPTGAGAERGRALLDAEERRLTRMVRAWLTGA
jgi:creatinine amidohydrolase